MDKIYSMAKFLSICYIFCQRIWGQGYRIQLIPKNISIYFRGFYSIFIFYIYYFLYFFNVFLIQEYFNFIRINFSIFYLLCTFLCFFFYNRIKANYNNNSGFVLYKIYNRKKNMEICYSYCCCVNNSYFGAYIFAILLFIQIKKC